MYKRIIPRIDIKNNNLVKGINLEGLRVLGDPRFFIEKYYLEGADEIYLQDVTASLYNKSKIEKIIEDIAKNIFINISAGGGIRSNSDIEDLLLSGADKVSLNTAVVNNPKFLTDAVDKYGSSTISVNIETLNVEGKYKVFTETGRQTSKYELFDWIKIIQDLGAGEIVITSIKNEGRKNGFDISLYEKSSKLVNIPLIAHGGAGNSNHIIDLFKKTDVDGVLLASILHYDKIISLSGKKNTGNFSFLNENLNNAKKEKVDRHSLSKIKSELSAAGIKIRT